MKKSTQKVVIKIVIALIVLAFMASIILPAMMRYQ